MQPVSHASVNQAKCQNFQCAQGTTAKKEAAEKFCSGSACQEVCCNNPTCSDFKCGAGTAFIDDNKNKRCIGQSDCQSKCCENTCETFKCAGYSSKIKGIDKKVCGTSKRCQETCCEVRVPLLSALLVHCWHRVAARTSLLGQGVPKEPPSYLRTRISSVQATDVRNSAVRVDAPISGQH